MQAITAGGERGSWVDQKVIQLLADLYPALENRWWGNLTQKRTKP